MQLFGEYRGIEDGETKRERERVLRRMQIYIHEYLVNHILNKSETIFISILSIIEVFLYVYFGD